jgi:hypothetical protein
MACYITGVLTLVRMRNATKGLIDAAKNIVANLIGFTLERQVSLAFPHLVIKCWLGLFVEPHLTRSVFSGINLKICGAVPDLPPSRRYTSPPRLWPPPSLELPIALATSTFN